MAMVNFKKGLRTGLPATYSEGTFYVTTDERAIYLDVSNSARIRLGDFQEFATLSDLEANANPSTTALYYVSDINCMAKWTGAEYVQVNRDTGVTSVEVVGEGNAVTAAVYSADNRKLTLTKGATYMTAADVDGKISTAIGALGHDEEGNAYANVKAYVDAKTEGIATDAALAELQEDLNKAEEAIENLKKANEAGGDVANAIKAAEDAAKAAQETADSKATMAEVEAKGYQTAEQVQAIADGKDEAIATAQAKADAAYTLAEGKATMVQVNEAIAGAGHAVKSEVDTAIENLGKAYVAADTALEAKLQGNIDKKVDQTAYDTKVGELEGAIATEKSRAEGIESGLRADVDAIKGDYLKAEDKAELQNQINLIMNNPDTEKVINSISEFTQYIEEHGDIAEGLRTDIDVLKVAVGTEAEGEEGAEGYKPATGLVKGVADNAAAIAAEKLRAEGEEAKLAQADATNLQTAKNYADAAVEALGIADYVKKADADAAYATVGHNHDDKYDAIGAAGEALEGAKAYADGLKQTIDSAYAAADTALSNRIKDLEDNKAGYATTAQVDTAKADAISAAATDAANKDAVVLAEAQKGIAAVQTALDTYKSTNNEEVAKKANSADVYGKGEVYTKDEVDAAVEAAVSAANSWGSF
jgi:hypothetical protein